MNLKEFCLSDIDIEKTIKETIINCPITLEDINDTIKLIGELSRQGVNYKAMLLNGANRV